MPSLRTLKILVAVMGVLLVGGVAALVIALAGRASRIGSTAAPFAAVPVEIPVEIPAGARIETIGTGTDRAVLDLVLSDGSRQLLVIELTTGRTLGRIPVRVSPP